MYNTYADNQKFDYRSLKDSVVNHSRFDPKNPATSTALRTGANIVNSSQSLRNYSEAVDNDFLTLKNQAFGDPEELKMQELEKFRQQKEILQISKSDEEKLVDKFFLELKYKEENEKRRKAEIDEIQQNVSVMERFVATAKDIELKKEMKSLSTERITLAHLEKELYDDIVKFKVYYDKLEYDRLSGKHLTPAETREKLQKLNDVKYKKEQIDYERHRLKSNLEAIKAGELTKIKKNSSELLQLTEKRKNYTSDYTLNPAIYGVENLRHNINTTFDKLNTLKLDRTNFLKNESRFNTELDRVDETEDRKEWMSELDGQSSRDKTLKLNDKTQMQPISHNQTLNLTNVTQSNPMRGPGYGEILKTIDHLKTNYGNGTSNAAFLKDLTAVQSLYQDVVKKSSSSPNKSLAKNPDTRSMVNLTSSHMMPFNDPSRTYAGDAFSNRFSAFDNKIHSAKNQQQTQQYKDNTGNNLSGSPNAQQKFTVHGIVNDPLTEFKLGTEKISKMLDQGHTALHDIQYKFANGQTVSPPGGGAGFGRDAVSSEEKQLQEYALQEQELLSTLYSLPSGTLMYQQTLNRITELSQLKVELEKIVREQKLSRNWELQNQQKDPYEERKKQQISMNLKKKMYGVKYKAYDTNLGFIVNFEWMSILPKDYTYCQVVYGVYAVKEILASPSLMTFHKCETHMMRYKKCVFDEKYYVYDVVPITPALLIFQIEAHFAPTSQVNDRVEILGWTMVDLFDNEGELKRGKWKLPVYIKPSNTAITVDEIRFLRRIKDLWLYIRILLPNDEDFLADGSRPAEALAAEHVIPEIHARWLEETKPFEELGTTRIEEVYPDQTQQSIVQDQSTSGEVEEEPEEEDDEANKTKADTDLDVSKHPQKADLDKTKTDIGNTSGHGKGGFEPSKYDINLMAMKGIKVTVVGLKDYSTLNKFRVAGALMDGNQVIQDENGKPCAFTTKAKVLLDMNRQALDISRADASMMNNAKSKEVGLNEEVLFLKNLPALIAAKQNNLDIILVFQVIEAEYTGDKTDLNTTTNRTMLNTTRNKTMNKTMMTTNSIEEGEENPGNSNVKDLDEDSQKGYKIASWFAMKINQEDGSITYGRFDKPLFFEPIVKPPFDEEKLPRTETTIDFIIEEFTFDNETLASHRKKKGKKSKKDDPEASARKKGAKKHEWVIDPRPFIINTKRQYIDRPFEKGNGIDFYIDGARFLPDNVTVTKVILTILTQSMEKIAVQADLPLLNSTTFSPIFRLKKELRASHFDPTAIAFISLETVDKIAEEVRTVGYCAMNLFLSNKTKEAPTNEAENDVILLNGNYQLPIYCQEPYRKRPFSMQRMVKLDRMPCASLLVRVYQAPKTDDGLKVLSKEDVPEKDWEKKGVWNPAPPYGAGLYNTSFCKLRDSEKDLFDLRQQREDPILKTTAAILMNSEGITHEMDKEEEVLDWLDDKITKTTSTDIIDLQFFAKYQPKSGFKFALDGFHNVPDKDIPYIGLYCLNPPAALYQTPINANLIHLNSNFNWEDSAAASPQFLEGFVTFKDVKFDKNLTIIIDIQTVVFKKKTIPTFKPIGWTVLPVFSSNGYVQSGIYQLPVFQGPAIKDIIEQLPLNDPWPFLLEQMAVKKSRLKFLEPMSAIVRLLDSQREGHFQKTFDYERMDYRFLPKKKIGTYAYNVAVDSRLQKAKRLTTIVPSNGNPKEFNKKITAAFVQELGLTQYQLE